MKVVCLQPTLFQERKKCYEEIENLIKLLLNEVKICDLVCLPERWVPLYNNLSQNIQKERSEDYHFIKSIAERFNLNILSGAIWEKRKEFIKPFITCYYFNNKGEEIGRQDKLHLYKYEKKYFEPGKELILFKLKEICFSILICFDIAFYETPRLAAEHGADILFSPTQIREEGMDNWKVYLQARALENRIPIAACNTIGKIYNRRFLGSSKIISFIKGYVTPSKLKIVEGPLDMNGFVYDDVDIQYAKKLRNIRLNEKIEMDSIKIITKN